MKLSEEDLKKMFEQTDNPTAIRRAGSLNIQNSDTGKDLKDARKAIKKVREPQKRKKSGSWGEFINSILIFFAYTGFAGFILFMVLGWGGISKQLEWGYYVDYLNENISATVTPRPKTSVTRVPIDDRIAMPGSLPQITNFPDNTLTIDKINLSAPVIWNVEEEIILDKLKDGVAHYNGTSLPGEGGNIFIVGHSSNYFWVQSDYNNIFALLDKLQPRDRIEVSYKGNKYVYEVQQTTIVKPNEVQVLENTPKETLSLMTCWPIGTSLKRMLVQAELLYFE